MLKAGLFSRYKIGQDESLFISHLQFGYDTLILEDKIWVYMRDLEANHILFEVISGLKLSFNKKSMLVGLILRWFWIVKLAASVFYTSVFW